MLFTPIKIGQLTLPGRLIKTATSETRASDDGFVTDELLDFYLPIAAGGTPLIITGNFYTSIDGKSTPRQPGADHDDKLPALARLVSAVHQHGAKIFAQLSHCGRQVVPRFAGLPEAVSASDVKDLITGTRPRPLTAVEISRIVQQFADAAGRCQRAGFDGIQIHAAHGYLVGQFLTPHTNRRTDDYGGSPERRIKLLRDVFGAIRTKVGSDFPVILKLNGSDSLPLRRGLKTRELAEIAVTMEREGVDAIEVSVGHYESGFPVVRGRFGRCLAHLVEGSMRHVSTPRRWLFRFFRPLITLACNLIWSRREGFNLEYARAFKARLSIPVICVGGFLTRDAMEAALEQQWCDAIAVGRGFIADPLLYQHLRDGVTGPRCNDCNACVGLIGTQPLDCYHPGIRAEKDAMLAQAGFRRAASEP
jgi:2,4-dienoyl-CoA reductase-like NADH-dependent reductase (Old Yellow Enzyme family)